jgi:hypothetical protein
MFCIRQIREKEWEHNEAVHQISIELKKVYDLFSRDFVYNFSIAFGIPINLVRLIKLSMTGANSRIRVGKNLSDLFPIRNGLKQVDALSPLPFNFPLGYVIRRVQVKKNSL